MPLDFENTLWSTAEAAKATRVAPGTVRSWVRRGHLKAAGLDERYRPLYRASDVLRAEQATRKHARRDPFAAALIAQIRANQTDQR